MTLWQIGGEALNFDLNEAINVKMPSRPRESSEGDALRITPEFATFQVRQWLPVQRDVNIVRVRKTLFYVKSIVFGDSKWSKAAHSREEQ